MKRIAAMLVIICASAICAAQEMTPDLDHPWTDGRYSTITEPFCTGGVKPKSAKWLKLNVKGMKSSVWTRAVIQNHPAPLVVILNGTFGHAADPEANLLMAWLEEKGYHAFTFDSTFLPAMNEASRHGVAGNLAAEAELSARIIQTFLQHREMAGKVTQIGVAGMSYGGTQALLLAKMSAAGKLPFRLDAVQAYSPPADVASSMRILDDSFTYEWKLSDHYWKFSNLPRAYPMREQYDPKMMSAALGRVFRMGLQEVTERNDRLYGAELDKAGATRLMPRDAERDERLNYAEVVSFSQYFNNIAAPYWKARGQNDLLEDGNLKELLKCCGANVEVIIASNDPLNEQGAVEELQRMDFGKKLTVLPCGGHLGYINAKWTRSRLCNMFPGHSDVVANK